MTTTDPEATPRPQREVAAELLALTALADRVAARIAVVKEDEVAGWEQGSKQTLNLPGDRPNTVRKIGEVRQDGGQTVALISDRPAWEAWCRAEAPQHVLRSRDFDNRHPDLELVRTAMLDAFDAGKAASEGFGVTPNSIAVAMYAALESHGLTLADLVETSGTEQVAPAWESAVLEASKDAGEPAAPGDKVPAGVTVTNNPPRPVVVLTAKKNTALVDEWIATQPPLELLAAAPAATDPE